ncbi:fungal-specific transcription factor domain-containing protein [Ephemerocybe angulata]|uniref:Fungal-specific transcription factor domain-containing protein n=1 Tax=Ephemerocybe angulata TaxID=980116 RepID=A0A8H6I8J7_9AGAR|nr:fungal-specific transcription factor domain-containing protein [Tulosesus angulatus]
MPPEQKVKLKRRSSRKELDEFRFDGTHARELEMKRNRGTCAECRRLKIKCDKQIPCQSCQRRGCTALCPNGSLSTGQGTRFVLAATEHLHKRISKLSNRVRQLEDALATLQAKHSSEPHPLLHADLISASQPSNEWNEDVTMDVGDDYDEPVAGPSGGVSGARETVGVGRADGPTRGEKVEKAGDKEVIDAFGTLSISQHGVSRFFGPTGGSESLLLSNMDTPYYDLPAAVAAAVAASGQQQSQQHTASSSSPALSFSPPASASSANPTHATAYPSHSNLLPSSSPDHLREDTHSPGAISNATSGSGQTTTLDATLSLFSSSFPFTPISQPPASVQALIEREHLPKWEIALGLCRTYFTEVAWLFRGLTRGQVFDDMLPALYKREKRKARFNEDDPGDREGSINNDGEPKDENGEHEEEWTGPHDLALLFMVFAIGALVGGPVGTSPMPSARLGVPGSSSGPAPPPSFSSYTGPAQAEHFYHLSRAALSLSPILEKPSIVTVQTLHLMSVYNAMSGSDMRSETSMEMTWGCVTLGAHLGQSIGLHRDSARWGLSRKMVQRRRILFWDLFVADVWQSLNTGRPPTFSLPYVDCSFPQYEEDFGGTSKEGLDVEYELWSFRFAAEVVAEVTARTLTAEAPTYATIMELDKRVRDFPLPASMTRDGKVGPGGLGGDQRGDGRDGDGGKRDGDYVVDFQRCVLEHIKETILLYIHRSFFAQAIIDHPENPLKSAYAPSFLASYRASSTILKCVIEQFKVWPGSSARFWTMWTFAFTAAVVFGTVVTRGPKSPLAKSAMRELEQACVLFSKASMYSVRATKALPILKKLNEKAHYALQAAQSSSSDPSLETDAGLHWSVKQEDTDDELAIFAGHTRFVSATTPLTHAPPPPPAATHTYAQRSSEIHAAHSSRPVYAQHPRPAPAGLGTISIGGPSGEAYSSGSGLYSMEQHHSQPQLHAQPQHQPQHHQQYSYAPQETRRMSGYESNGWAGPSSAGLHEPQHHHQAQPQPQHHQPQPNHRVLPRISRLPSHSSHVMYTSPASSYPNSSNESIELVPVPQAPSSTDYADYGQHQQQHQQPHTHHPPPPTHNPYQHPEHQQHHHQHHPQPPAPSTPQYQPMLGGPGIGSGHGDHRMSGIAPTTSSDLADLGIASRDSRLDEKWSMFMSESGILEPGFRG